MELERTINVSQSEPALRECISEIFIQSGYRLISSTPVLIFRRGSLLGSMVAFTPKSWIAKVRIAFGSMEDQGTQVSIRYEINTTYQWVTEKERKFWEDELDTVSQSIKAGKLVENNSQEKASSALQQNMLALLILFGMALIFAVGAGIIFRSINAAYIGLAVGIGFGSIIIIRWMKVKF